MNWDSTIQPLWGNVEAADWSGAAEELTRAWPRVLEEIRRVAVKQTERWALRVIQLSLRPDTGCAHFEFASTHEYRGHDLIATLKFPFVEEQYYELPDSEADVAGFESSHDQLVARWAATFRSATSSEAYASLTGLASNTLVVRQYDDTETEQPFFDAPPERPPAAPD